MSYTIANQRYKQLQNRHFARQLDLFLSTQYMRVPEPSISSATLECFQNFEPTEEEFQNYRKSWQASTLSKEINGTILAALNDAIKQWQVSHKAAQAHFKHQAIKAQGITQDSFQQFYGQDEGERICHYCQIKEQEFALLLEHNLLYTKRLGTRGRRLEVDCKLPQLGYTPANNVLCCYWCDNAKSDEFTEQEFLSVGQSFTRLWQARLNQLRVTLETGRPAQCAYLY